MEHPVDFSHLSRNQLEDYFLILNNNIKELINQLIHHIDQKLDLLCRDSLDVPNGDLSSKEDQTQQETHHTKVGYSISTFATFKAPYIKDIKQLTSPPNQDTRQQKELSQCNLICDKMHRFSLWSDKSKRRLLDAVLSKYSNEHIADLLRQKYHILSQLRTITGHTDLSSCDLEQVGAANVDTLAPDMTHIVEELKCKLRLIEEQSEQVRDKSRPYIFVPEDREDKNIDWLAISAKLSDVHHDNYDCNLMWKNQLHPAINNSPWSKEEDDQLVNLVLLHGVNSWDIVSRNLNTNRLAWQCCSRYHSEYHNDVHKGLINSQDFDHLNDIVDLCRVGDYIPWNQVMYFVEGCTKQHVKYIWLKSAINCKRKTGKWNEYEDLALMIAVRLFGEDFARISSYIPGRSNKSIRERYSMRLSYGKRSLGEWSQAEDTKLLALAEKYDRNWSKIAREMKNRNHHQVRSRFVLLDKSTAARSSKIKSKNHYIYDPFNYFLKSTPKTVVISKLNLKSVQGGKDALSKRTIYEEFLNIIRRKLKIFYDLSLSKSEIQDSLSKEIFIGSSKPKNLSTEAEIDNQLLEIFSSYSHVKSTKSLVCRTQQDEKIYQCAVDLIYRKMMGSIESIEGSNLLETVLIDALNEKVTKMDPHTTPIFPPNLITIRGLRGFIMQQGYLESIIGNDESFNTQEFRDILSSSDYLQLRSIIISLFSCPLLLSNRRPPNVDSQVWDSFNQRKFVENGSKNFYKLRDLQSKLTENK